MAPKVNAERLWHDLQHTGTVFGGTQKGGVNRPCLSDIDKAVRDWFVDQGKKIKGASVRWDDMGNIYIRRPGTNPNLVGQAQNVDETRSWPNSVFLATDWHRQPS